MSKGDATVTFEDPSASDGAISWFDGKVFEGKTIKVEKAQAIKPPPGMFCIIYRSVGLSICVKVDGMQEEVAEVVVVEVVVAEEDGKRNKNDFMIMIYY